MAVQQFAYVFIGTLKPAASFSKQTIGARIICESQYTGGFRLIETEAVPESVRTRLNDGYFYHGEVGDGYRTLFFIKDDYSLLAFAVRTTAQPVGHAEQRLYGTVLSSIGCESESLVSTPKKSPEIVEALTKWVSAMK